MTMQSTAPLRRIAASAGNEPVTQVAFRPGLVLDPPYQRGSVWGVTRRRNLLRSILLGVPVGLVYLNRRPDMSTAVVDGKQRIETIRAFLADEFSLPTSWFDQEDIVSYRSTADGPYVLFSDLTSRGQGKIERGVFTTQITDFPLVAQEAELFDLVNFGGLAQGQEDEEN